MQSADRAADWPVRPVAQRRRAASTKTDFFLTHLAASSSFQSVVIKTHASFTAKGKRDSLLSTNLLCLYDHNSS